MDHHRPHKGSNGRGRIHPHMRGANVTGTIIGKDIAIYHQYAVIINERGRIHRHERNAKIRYF